MKATRSLVPGLLVWCAVLAGPAALLGAGEAGPEVFVVRDPDRALSPYTGVVRRHWYEAARYLLDGAFSYVHSPDDALKFPKQPGKSYPRSEAEVPTEKLEGLCRTLFAAAPLLKADPDLQLNGIRVGDYYRHHFGLLVDPTSASFIKPRPANGGPSQNLVEFGALAMAFFAAPEVLWDPLPQREKDALAALMLSYGDGPTVPSNWKFFNVFVLSFFKQRGYPVNEALLEEYLRKTLADYRGDGWYNDNPAYDYYSMWAYQLYGMLWAQWFGREHYPGLARQFEANFWDLRDNYPRLFGRDGKMILWGRSNSYRFASVGTFPLMGFEHRGDVNYGWMRRIASGVLLQFLTHPKFLDARVPTLGFYGPFEPAVQVYSCRGSAYWMGKVFLGLLVPADSPFWTAVENEGSWAAEFQRGTVINTFQPASKILITDYPNSGAAEVRAWCHERVADDWQQFRSTENYNRLAYNSAFPWQADGPNGEVAMNYVARNAAGKWEALRLYTFLRFESGIYQRTAVLETDEHVRFDLAEQPLPNGILRVDRLSADKPLALRLGHYALPHLHGTAKVAQREWRGRRATIIDNGEYQSALVPVAGWDSVEVVRAAGLHPEAGESSVLNATAATDASGARLLVTLLLWKRSGEAWSDEELFPVVAVTPQGDSSCSVAWASGASTTVSFR
ncbi:MAG TPA: DUF2264 domain-containing protein [Opitutaceae bacterium]|nr:DUF2264 domain-containing protein [Opitutaceae bacterium]